MDNKILELKEKFVSDLEKIDNLADIENIRVSYLGKKGSVTDLLKGCLLYTSPSPRDVP